MTNTPELYKRIESYHQQLLNVLIRKDDSIYNKLSEDLKKKKTFNLYLLGVNLGVFKYFNDVLLNDKDFIKECLLKYPECFAFQNFEISKDEIIQLLDSKPEIFKCFTNKMRSSKIFAKVVLAKDGMMIEYMPKQLRSDPEIIDLAIKQNSSASKFCIKKK